MTPERKLFEEVRDYIGAGITRMGSTVIALEMAEMKFGRDVVDACMKDMIRKSRLELGDNKFPHTTAALQALAGTPINKELIIHAAE